MSESSTDRIEKQILLRAPLARVWRALSDAREFGAWFGVELEGAFEPGARLRGRITHKGYEDAPFELFVERVEPERHLSWRWHPYAHDPAVDYSGEPTTLVVFELEPVADGVLLRVTESGFDAVPLERRATAFAMNEEGWGHQMSAIERYLADAT
jgi:uncharacterized protein YndB with AHSA1/START domain